MTDTIALLSQQLERNFSVIKQNAEGLTTEQSLLALVEDGSTLLGHLIVSRDGILRALDTETVWDEAARENYGFGTSATNIEKPLDSLLADLARSQEKVKAALSAASPAQLEAKRPNGSSVAEFVEFLVWHDSYHTGQTTLYRRLAGLESPIG